MREKHNDNDGSRLVDVFQICANSTNCNKAIYLYGDLGLASILFKYELGCANFSACESTTITILADCGKISDTHICKILY